MFTLISVILMIVFGIYCVIHGFFFESGYDHSGTILLGVVILIVGVMAIGFSYYENIVTAPHEYTYYKTVVKETKEVLNLSAGKQIELKDIEMGKQISNVIKDLRNFEKGIQIKKVSPFTIFKPTIVID